MPTIVTSLSPEISDFPSRLAILVGVMTLIAIIAAMKAGETKHIGLRESIDKAEESHSGEPQRARENAPV